MAKVRFELNIDEIVERSINDVVNDDVSFKTQDATNKTFLFIDKMTGMMHAAYCRRAATVNNKCAQIDFFPIPNSAVIIDEDVKDDKYEALMSHIEDYCNKINQSIISCQNEVNMFIGQEFDALRKDMVTGDGISEKTLLEALRIVSKQSE